MHADFHFPMYAAVLQDTGEFTRECLRGRGRTLLGLGLQPAWVASGSWPNAPLAAGWFTRLAAAHGLHLAPLPRTSTEQRTEQSGRRPDMQRTRR